MRCPQTVPFHKWHTTHLSYDTRFPEVDYQMCCVNVDMTCLNENRLPGLVRIVIPIREENEEVFDTHVLSRVAPEMKQIISVMRGGESRHESISRGVRQLDKGL